MPEPFTDFSPNNSDVVNNNVNVGGWQALGAGAVGARIFVPEYSDKTVHITGNFSGGASASMRGSCKENPDPDVAGDWNVVHAAHDGADIAAIVAAYLAVTLESPSYLSPLITSGDGSTSINIDITAKKGS